MQEPSPLLLVLLIGGALAVTGVMVALLIAMAIWMSRRSARQVAEIEATWAALAQSLGLAVEAKGGGPPTLTGTYRGRPLRIIGSYGRGDNSGHTHVAIQTDFRADVYLRKSINRILGVEYLPSGDAELDKRFAFQSRPPHLVTRAAADPALRRAMNATEAWLLVEPRIVASHASDVDRDPEHLRAMIEQAAEAADFVEQQIGVTIPESAPLTSDQYSALNKTATIRAPRWVWPIILVLAVLLLAACMCAAAWPALGPILLPLLGR